MHPGQSVSPLRLCPHLRSDTIRGLGLGAVLRAVMGPRGSGADRGEQRSGLRPHQFLASWR